jgi:hypothetical protein
MRAHNQTVINYLSELCVNIWNPFRITYKEKDAIKGHSVDRYNYAIQLINERTDGSLIKAFVWLSLAADEIDMAKEAGRLKHQLGFELKQKNLFEQAAISETVYREKYSADAIREKLKASSNPLCILENYLIIFIEKVDVFFSSHKRHK